MKNYSYYFLSAVLGFAAFAVVPAAGFAGQPERRATVAIPEAINPDACQGSQAPKDCKRWYYLTEVERPDAWKYAIRNHHEPLKRWYSVQQRRPVALAEKPSRIIVLEGINFNYDKSDLRPDSLPILGNNVDDLKSENTIKVKIVGYTDSQGSDEYNQKLSERRSQSVADYFAGQGVASTRLSAEGRGESDPIAPNATPAGKDNPTGRAQNRRVEIHIWDSYANSK